MTDNSNREKCEGCGIVAGRKEESFLFDHRGHRVCSWCVANWSERDKRAKREISLEEYHRGIPGGLNVLLRIDNPL